MDVANDIFSTSTLCLPAIIEPNILLLGVWGQDQAHLRSFNVSGPRAPYTDAQRSAMRSLSLISKTNVNYFNDTIGLIMVNFAICIYIYGLQSRRDFSLPRYQLCAAISAYFLSAEERVYSCRCWESLAECRIAFLQRGTSESQAHTHNPPRKHKYQPQLGTTRWCQFQTALSLENPWWLKGC